METIMTEQDALAGRAARDSEVWAMFDRIAPRYDLLNRLLSFRRDVAWRKRMARFLDGRTGLRVLDLATGTGDQILHLLEGGADIAEAVGLDMAENMLAIGREKIAQRGLEGRVSLQVGDAVSIPLEDGGFDVVTITFGIRNVGDVSAALREMFRALKPGGRALVLEFSIPGNPVFRPVYVAYLRHVLPWLGGCLSGDREAYRYLNETVEAFPYGEAFCDLMRSAGFVEARAWPLSLGIATIYSGDRPA